MAPAVLAMTSYSRSPVSFALIALTVVLSGCEPRSRVLLIDLATDFRPTEFVHVRTEIAAAPFLPDAGESPVDGGDPGVDAADPGQDAAAPGEDTGVPAEDAGDGRSTLHIADPSEDYLHGVRIYENSTLPEGPWFVRVSLLDAGGAVLAERRSVVVTRGNHALVVVVGRRCTTTCPPEGEPNRTECRGDACADPLCGPTGPEPCPDPECDIDADCAATCPGGACAEGICLCPAAACAVLNCADPTCAGRACDDGNPCTVSDACGGGLCAGSYVGDNARCPGANSRCCGGACIDMGHNPNCGFCGLSCPQTDCGWLGLCTCTTNQQCRDSGFGPLATCSTATMPYLCQCVCNPDTSWRGECLGQCPGNAVCVQQDNLNACRYP